MHGDRKGSLYLSPRQDSTLLRLCRAIHPAMRSSDRKGCHVNSQTLLHQVYSSRSVNAGRGSPAKGFMPGTKGRCLPRARARLCNLLHTLCVTTATTNSADDWMRIGVPEQDAHHYQSELDAGRSIVLIKAVGSPEQALSILRQSGAYDIAFRFRTAPPTMPSETYNSNAQPGTYNPNAAQGTHNPNAQPGTYNPNAQPGTYDATQPQPGQPITRGE